MKKLLSPKEVAELLGMSPRLALHIMRTQMHTIQTGRNPNNPRYKVTMDEIEAWQVRSSRVAEPPITASKSTSRFIERKSYA